MPDPPYLAGSITADGGKPSGNRPAQAVPEGGSCFWRSGGDLGIEPSVRLREGTAGGRCHMQGTRDRSWGSIGIQPRRLCRRAGHGSGEVVGDLGIEPSVRLREGTAGGRCHMQGTRDRSWGSIGIQPRRLCRRAGHGSGEVVGDLGIEPSVRLREGVTVPCHTLRPVAHCVGLINDGAGGGQAGNPGKFAGPHLFLRGAFAPGKGRRVAPWGAGGHCRQRRRGLR